MRKYHLLNSYNNVACQGRTGMSLRGEFIAGHLESFKNADKGEQCAKCLKSNYFSYLLRQEAKKAQETKQEEILEVSEDELDDLDAWEAEDPAETIKRDQVHFALLNNRRK